MSTVIGIDPGKSGGLAAIHDDGIVVAIPMPLAGKELDIPFISDWIYGEAKHGGIVCIEKVGAIARYSHEDGTPRKQGAVGMFNFGKNTGILYGIVGCMLLPLYEVAPPTWKKVVLMGTTKDKQAAITFCSRVYPKVSLLATTRSKKAHDGMADALCIAHYALGKYKDVL